MKIIKWLRKVAQEPPRETSAVASCPTNKKESNSVAAQSKDVVLLNHPKGDRDQRQKKRVEKIRFGCKNFDLFSFSSSFNLKRAHTVKMKEGMNNNRGSEFAAAVHVGNNTKVLPINDAATAVSSSQKCGINEDKRDQKVKTEKTKAFSKMKELLKWAAATKTEKGGKYIRPKVLQYRNRETLKPAADDDKLSSESPKMSFRWDTESCSTNLSSVFSTLSASSSTRNIDQTNMNMPPPFEAKNSTLITRTGNWITTDSEFVVLEL